MTKNQVESLIGRPRWEVKPKNPKRLLFDRFDSFTSSLPNYEWWGAKGVVKIWYSDGRVSRKDFTKHRFDVIPLRLTDGSVFLDLIPMSHRRLEQ
jgi:hypothetical protein